MVVEVDVDVDVVLLTVEVVVEVVEVLGGEEVVLLEGKVVVVGGG